MLKIPEKIKFVLRTLTQNGYEAYIVGGCVRDSLLGIIPSDYDVTTSAKPEEILGLFDKTVPTGLKHGTVTVIIENEPIEVTTFRTDGEYKDSRHPQNVKFVTDLREDLSRRDFTVNAVAYNETVGLVDLFGGLSDLENKILRAVGDGEKRFKEDALRILRLFRFASQLEFTPEEKTLKSALKLQNGLKNISKERIFSEIVKAVNGKNPKAILPLINSGGLEFLGICKTPEFTTIDDSDLRLFVFLNTSSENPIEVLKTLKAPKRQIDFANKLLKLQSIEMENKEDIKNALFLTDFNAVNLFFKHHKAEDKLILLDEVIKNREPYLISHLAISGEDLRKLGFEGKEIGEILERLRQTVVCSPEKNRKEILLTLTKCNSAP
jgi:tRNA nucleotidyltransferase (CCA-adding enzyme)